MSQEQPRLTLIPGNTTDAMRQRDNERRIEQFVRKLLAAQQAEGRSYVRTFLTMK